jgi:Protein of unknown function (DUF3153)
MKFSLVKIFDKFFPTTRLLALALMASLALSGCVKYDVSLTFDNSNSGELIQHIKLGDRLTSFSGDSVQEWLNSIERRARKLEGKAKRISPDDVIVTIPFNSSKELETKFNQFFNPNRNANLKADKTQSESDIPDIQSLLRVDQNNFLLAVRNKLTYDIDLTSLGFISNQNSSLANSGSIIDLEFALKTPLGAKNLEIPEIENPLVLDKQSNRQFVWHLQPGQLNHIEVVFWLPSPLGIGSLLIIIIVGVGIYLRDKKIPELAADNPN